MSFRVLCVNPECHFHNLGTDLPGPAHGLCASCASKELVNLQGVIREWLAARLELSIARLRDARLDPTIGKLRDEPSEVDQAYDKVGNAFAKLTETVGAQPGYGPAGSEARALRFVREHDVRGWEPR